MEQTFRTSEWKPTKVIQVWEQPLPQVQLAELVAKLAADQERLRRHPYDPRLWIRRAHTHSQLQYPELAVGDACKASLLCKSLLRLLDQNLKPNYRMGANAGFWMRHVESEEEYETVPLWLDKVHLESEQLAHRARFTGIQIEADQVATDNLEYAPSVAEGRFCPQSYPWMEVEHSTRSDEVLDQINAELANPAVSYPRKIVAKRYALGKGVGAHGGADLLGLFALRDVLKDETVMWDRSKTWGCVGPGEGDDREFDHDGLPAEGRAANLNGGAGCANFIHPNQKGDNIVKHDLRWIRDRLGPEAAHTIVLARFFLACIQDGVEHPLSHTLIARLTPSYRVRFPKTFSVERDITVMMEVLQQFDIDIFANKNYDTWVFFELDARVANNSWTDLVSACVSPLFSLLNHSCEPNLGWHTLVDHATLSVTAKKDIKKGEQFFVEYDQFQHAKPLAARRKRLENWFDSDCQCTRCVREENEELQKMLADAGMGGLRVVDGSSLGLEAPSWNTGGVVELPEDRVGDFGGEKQKKRKKQKKMNKNEKKSGTKEAVRPIA